MSRSEEDNKVLKKRAELIHRAINFVNPGYPHDLDMLVRSLAKDQNFDAAELKALVLS